MTTAVVEVQHLLGLGPAVGHQGPDPRGPVVDRTHAPSPAQALGLGLPVQTAAQFHRLAAPTDQAFVAQAAAPVGGRADTLLPVAHAQFQFVPLDVGLAAVRVTPARASETDLATVDH